MFNTVETVVMKFSVSNMAAAMAYWCSENVSLNPLKSRWEEETRLQGSRLDATAKGCLFMHFSLSFITFLLLHLLHQPGVFIWHRRDVMCSIVLLSRTPKLDVWQYEKQFKGGQCLYSSGCTLHNLHLLRMLKQICTLYFNMLKIRFTAEKLRRNLLYYANCNGFMCVNVYYLTLDHCW